MKKTLLLFLLLLIPSVIILGQNNSINNIKGRVVDSLTSEPMVGVVISCNKCGIECRTNYDGFFEICLNDSTDLCILEISYIGYKKHLIDKNRANHNDTLLIKLKRDEMINVSELPKKCIKNNNSLIDDSIVYNIVHCNAQKPTQQYVLTYFDYLDNCLFGFVILNLDSIVFYQERLTFYGNDINGVWDTITLHTITKKDTLFKYIKMIQDLNNDTVFYNIDTNFICDGGFPPFITLYKKNDESCQKLKEWTYYETAVFTPTFIDFSNFIWGYLHLYRKGDGCNNVGDMD